MNESELNRWVNQILTTEEIEISCSDCFERISEYVEMEIGCENMPEALLQVKQHLQQCGICEDEYKLLRELIQTDSKEIF